MNPVIFMILSLLFGIYGIYHYTHFESEKKGMGYVEVSGIILSQSNYTPPRPGTGGASTGSYHRQVKFNLNGEEHQADVFATGTMDSADIGKMITILVNQSDPSDAIQADFKSQRYTALGLMVASAVGMLISGYMIYTRFIA